jgi:DNA-binding PadR family transcriptional regulator
MTPRNPEVTSGHRAQASPDPSSFLPLKPDVFLILTILAEGNRHGYGIMQAAESWAGRGMEIQAGALYRRLRWMTREGLIQEVHGPDTASQSGDRRRTYRITHFGRRVAQEEGLRMAELLAAAREAVLVTDSNGG